MLFNDCLMLYIIKFILYIVIEAENTSKMTKNDEKTRFSP